MEQETIKEHDNWEDVIKDFQFSGGHDLLLYEYLEEYYEPPKRKVNDGTGNEKQQ